MNELEKLTQMGLLFGLYQNLLTDKQKMYFSMYYEDDYSLKEIADYYKVSRNAVHDQIKIVSSKLLEYEEKLKLLYKANQRSEFLDKYIETKDVSWLEKIKGLDE